MLRSLRTVLLAAGLFLVAGSAFAGPATETVKDKQTKLVEQLKKSPPDVKKANAVFDEVLDYPTLAQDSLGSEWANRSDAEKAEFSDILKQLVRKSYEKNIKKTLGFTVDYVGEDAADGKVVVKTRAKNNNKAGDEPLEIDYKLAEKDGTWRIQDIKTEGVSMVGSYRSQFVKIIKKDGFAKLIQKMKDRLAKGDA